jgi:hypothetical protein
MGKVLAVHPVGGNLHVAAPASARPSARSSWASALWWAIVDMQYRRYAGIFGPIWTIEQEAAHRMELKRPMRLVDGASSTETQRPYSTTSRQAPMPTPIGFAAGARQRNAGSTANGIEKVRMPIAGPLTPSRGKPGSLGPPKGQRREQPRL